MKLNTEQLKRVSEILGNIAVAWFTMGVISPLFAKPKGPVEVISPLVAGFSMVLFSANLSLRVIREIKS